MCFAHRMSADVTAESTNLPAAKLEILNIDQQLSVKHNVNLTDVMTKRSRVDLYVTVIS